MLVAEGVAQLAPGHELIKKLAGSVAAVAVQVPRNLEGRNHAEMVVCCSQTRTRCYHTAQFWLQHFVKNNGAY